MKIYSYSAFLKENGTPYLVKKQPFRADGRKNYDSPDAIAEFAYDSLGIHSCAEEYMYCLCLDNKLHLIGCFEVSHGSVLGTLAPPREIFQKALLLGAVVIALIHNHPSGDPTPSEEDANATSLVVEAGNIIGVKLADHVIVGRNGWISLKQQGCII